ncbi:MAG: DUF1818 family protein [Cyanobium sp.]
MEICQGQGWRLVIDLARHPYIALIGGSDWAAELTREELETLWRATRRLRLQHAALSDQLMAEESLELDLELPLAAAEAGASLWMALEGDRQHWSLRFVLTPGAGARAVEAGWSVAASGPFAAALEGLEARLGLVLD